MLARKEDVDANHFVLQEAKTGSVARGRNLGVALASNKGACGLAFRLFDMVRPTYIHTSLHTYIIHPRTHLPTYLACRPLVS